MCIEEIGKIADEHLSGGRVHAIPWVGWCKNDILKQNKGTLNEIFPIATKAKLAYDTTIRGALKRANVDADVFTSADIKSKARAHEKVENEYDGDYSRLVDIVRGMCKTRYLQLYRLKNLIGKGIQPKYTQLANPDVTKSGVNRSQ